MSDKQSDRYAEFPNLITGDRLNAWDCQFPLARCPQCRDTGFVIVAHPSSIRGGTARSSATLAVICTDCAVGREIEAKEPPDRKRWNFIRYTNEIGGLDGVELLREYDRTRKAETTPEAKA